MRRGISKLSEWSFSESLLATLPADKEHGNLIRGHIPNVIFSHIRPTPFVSKPKLVAVSSDVLRNILDMDPEKITHDEDFVEWVSGNKVLEGTSPMAHRYGGYQFGSWADQLGDGRAHLLGEYVNSHGERWEIQLKGSGRTPYSRFGDGRAVLRSSVREFLCSEAMHSLGVPTSRAASLILTEDMIIRDVLYNGRPTMEPCAVVMRLAPTWFRIGSLEILARRGELDELRQLLDFIVTHVFPDIKANNSDPDDQILELYARIVQESARLVARWMSVGFTHGVLNTDNLSLKSITIDYGPYGFLDSYDPYFIPNHSDDSGRYDYESQPEIVRWNLKKLLQALIPVISDSKRDRLQEVLGRYREIYEREWTEMFCQKLGLSFDLSNLKSDEKLARRLLNAMYSTGADFTQTFRDLSELTMAQMVETPENVCSQYHWGFAKVRSSKQFLEFLEDYKQRLESEFGTGEIDDDRQRKMKASNPRYILRNWIAQRAIEAADKGDFSEVQLVLKVLGTPFDFQPEAEAAGFAQSVPDWGKKLIVSCSS